MSDPFAASLSKFTPDTSGLDRDALLFAAGRASVPPRRGWMALAGVLAASQLVTLTLLGFQSARPPVVSTQGSDSIAVPNSLPSEHPEPSPDRAGRNYSPLRAQVLAAEDKLPAPEPIEQLAPAEPPLHAFAAPPSALFQ
jgi:hypothetical protein